MELEPVEKIDPPKYPADAELADAKAMLCANIPRRWRKAKGLAGAAAVFLAANLSGGCGKEAGNANVPKPYVPNITIGLTAVEPSQPDPIFFAEASEWVGSIFADKNKMPAVLMGEVLIVTPRINEDGIQGILQDNQN
jgi:hypothetical protein